MQVRDVMTTPVVTVSPETTFPDLVDRLLEHGISGLPVVDADNQLVGIVTEADLITKEAYGGERRRALAALADLVGGGHTRWAPKGQGATAAQVMTMPVHTARPSESVRAAARRMIEERVKRLPVVDDGRVVGILSRTDLLRLLHRSDDELRDEVAKLLADPLWSPEGHAVEAAVDDGIVALTGTVRYPMDIAVMTSIVWQVPGVVDVQNRVTPREADPTVSRGL